MSKNESKGSITHRSNLSDVRKEASFGIGGSSLGLKGQTGRTAYDDPHTIPSNELSTVQEPADARHVHNPHIVSHIDHSPKTDTTDWAVWNRPMESSSVFTPPETLREHTTESNNDKISAWIAHEGVLQSQLQSSQSSASAEPSSTTSSSANTGRHANRRQNPKALQTRMGSHGTTSLVDAVPVARMHGTGDLYRLCDTVPYLLGPLEYLEALQRVCSFPLREDAFFGHGVRFVVDPQKLRNADKALAVILLLLRTHEEERDSVSLWALHGLVTHKDRLVVHKYVGPNELPHPTAINFEEFLESVIAWERLPNPALVAEGDPSVKTPWATVVQMLQDRDINVEDMDRSLYFELTTLEGEALEQRLDELKDFSVSGDLQERKKRILASLAAAGMRPQNTFHYQQPMVRDRNAPYAMRFSHSHPHGKFIDPAEERHGDGLLDERKANPHHKPTIHEGIQALKEKKRKWGQTTWGKWIKGVIIILVVAGVLAVVLLVCYFQLGKGRKPSEHT